MTVEARRATGEALRVTSESFAIATIASDADRRCRRALLEEWVGRETASFRLPPSRLALDPGDVVQLDHDGRLTSLRLTSTADAGARVVEAVRTDAGAFGLAPGPEREAAGAEAGGLRPAERGVPRPAAAARERRRRTSRSSPSTRCRGRGGSRSGAARARTASSSSLRSAGRRGWGDARRRPLSGAESRFDLGNIAIVDLAFGTLASVTDVALFGGANALAVEAAPGVWEVLQFGVAELIAPGRYRLSRLLRGQRGTEGAMARRRRRAPGSWCSTRRWRRCRSARPRSGWRPTGASGRHRSRSSDRSYRALSFTPEGVGLRPFSVGHVEQPWRRRASPATRDPLDPPLAGARRRQLECGRGAARRGGEAYEVEILDGATVMRRSRPHDQRDLHRRPADRRLGRAARSRRHARRPHLPALRPRRAGRTGMGGDATVLRAGCHSPLIAARVARGPVTAHSPRREFGGWVVLVRWWTSLRAAWEIRRIGMLRGAGHRVVLRRGGISAGAEGNPSARGRLARARAPPCERRASHGSASTISAGNDYGRSTCSWEAARADGGRSNPLIFLLSFQAHAMTCVLRRAARRISHAARSDVHHLTSTTHLPNSRRGESAVTAARNARRIIGE